MGRMADLLEVALESISTKGSLILDEAFMMGIFQELRDELPPFDLYLSHVFEKKGMALVAQPANRDILFSKLRAELFSPRSETNRQTSTLAADLGATAGLSLLNELRDASKATAQYLSSASGKFS
jgi:hypothetical protein